MHPKRLMSWDIRGVSLWHVRDEGLQTTILQTGPLKK